MKRKPANTEIKLHQPRTLVDAIEKARGKTPRSRWINEACAIRLGLPVESLPGRGRPKK